MYRIGDIYDKNFDRKENIPANVHVFHQHMAQRDIRKKATEVRKQRQFSIHLKKRYAVQAKIAEEAKKNKAIGEMAREFMNKHGMKPMPAKKVMTAN